MVLQTSNSVSCRPGPTTPPAQKQKQKAEAEFWRGPWTVEEDLTLRNYITRHPGLRWDAVPHAAGLKRAWRSCQLRWLYYLRPDLKRGNFSAEDGWMTLKAVPVSKIAQHLPGRTDNEIRKYRRTRVQKHAKQLKCDVNSQRFKDTKYLWTPRLVESLELLQPSTGAGDDESAGDDEGAGDHEGSGDDEGSGDHEGSGDDEGAGDASCASGATMENSPSVVTRSPSETSVGLGDMG